MKKQLTIIIISSLIVMCNYNSRAQEYEYVPMPTQNAIWSQIYIEYDTISQKYALFDEDTLLDGKIYQKLFMIKGDTVLNRDKAHLVAFIREENKKVYEWGIYAGGENLIYDFDINEGDTLGVEFGYLFIVEKVDTIIINNTKRRRFHFRIGDFDFNDLIWIEGIGAIRGLFINTPVLKNGIIEIISIYGKLLIKEGIQPEQLKIDIGSIEKGIYIAKYISSDNEIYIRKFIKE